MNKIIYIISIFLLNASLKYTYVQPQSPTKVNKPYKNQAKAFYHAAQTGDKSSLKQSTKKLLKKFGLIHLLTPSGIHLSAILGIFIFFLPRKFHLFLFLAVLLYFLSFPSFYSLKRVLYFQIILFFLKGTHQTKAAFFFTFILDLISGGYSLSPLSFAYSFLFWGTIIFSPKKTVVLNLFIAQLIAVYFSAGELNFLAIVVNPVFTALYSFLFPLMSLNLWVLKFSLLSDLFVLFHHYLLEILSLISSLTSIFIIKKSSFLLILPFLRFKLLDIVTVTLFYSPFLNNKPYQHKELAYFYSLPHPRELISNNNKSLNFIDIKCTKRFKEDFWSYKCKKKPSKYGGPVF